MIAWIWTGTQPPEWSEYLMYAETFGLKPWEVENTPAIWFVRWKFQKAQIDAKTQKDMEK